MGNVETFGWDTVFAINFKTANQAITRGQSSPPRFSADYTDTLESKVFNVSGDFGTWQMDGGSGNLLHLKMPVSNGKVAAKDGSSIKNFSGHAIVEVELAFIPQKGASHTAGLQDLNYNKSTDAGRMAATVISFVFTASSNNSADEVPVKTALNQWLNSHADVFNHVFAVVDINAKVDKEHFQWLRPTFVNYAINANAGKTDDDNVFGVLAMTENRPVLNAGSEIDPRVIPEGNNAGFLISQERMCCEASPLRRENRNQKQSSLSFI